MEPRSREEDRLRLHGAIQDWNATRMDLFEISDPDMVRVIPTEAASQQRGGGGLGTGLGSSCLLSWPWLGEKASPKLRPNGLLN